MEFVGADAVSVTVQFPELLRHSGRVQVIIYGLQQSLPVDTGTGLGVPGRQNEQGRRSCGIMASDYCHRLMDDSPEVMLLDSSLFSNFIEKVLWLAIATV